jgi:prephenate dehydrogenase
MSEPDFLSSSRVAIVGLGLMGGSLALALRGKCLALLGVDPDPDTLALARQHRIADQLSGEPTGILAQADLVVLAAPVQAIIDLLRRLPELHPGKAVVLDLGSTKKQVTQVMDTLPARFDPVGGHPMCGKEKLTLEHADAALYQGAPFVFTALPGTSGRARTLVEQLAHAVGAYPIWLDPEVHDRWTAATSHLPYLIASALVSATPVEAAPLAGPGFRSTSRLAATSPGMMLDILVTNQHHILSALQRFRDHLDSLETLLACGDFAALQDLLGGVARQHGELTGDRSRSND